MSAGRTPPSDLQRLGKNPFGGDSVAFRWRFGGVSYRYIQIYMDLYEYIRIHTILYEFICVNI